MVLRSEWRLEAPVERVWEILARPEAWPQWWRYVAAVNKLREGDGRGVGAIYAYRWRSRLPYGLALTLRTVKAVKPVCLEGEAWGDVEGYGCWQLRSWERGTQLHHVWNVELSKRWMRLFAPLLAPVFRWNHHAVMRAGARGMAEHLGTQLVGYRAVPASETPRRDTLVGTFCCSSSSQGSEQQAQPVGEDGVAYGRHDQTHRLRTSR